VIYAVVIAIAAGLALLAIPAGLFMLGRKAAQGALSLRNWSWRPNGLGFAVLAILGAVVLWRIFPEVLFVPFIIPFFMRFRGRRSGGTSGNGGPFVWQWRSRRGQPPSSNGHKQDDDQAIEGQYRNVDDE
jgi:hypothetical protein